MGHSEHEDPEPPEKTLNYLLSLFLLVFIFSLWFIVFIEISYFISPSVSLAIWEYKFQVPNVHFTEKTCLPVSVH